ncbi:hypothetical protein TYRP_006186 [Tyrophagus putrescentiae]|nr:hypothetical protein TYRP_006186 [Tyrophagus putrescentiae]
MARVVLVCALRPTSPLARDLGSSRLGQVFSSSSSFQDSFFPAASIKELLNRYVRRCSDSEDLRVNVFAQHSDCTCIPQQCTAQGGEVWHLLATVNFRCLGPRERSERGPRRRKLTVAKRCRVSRRHSSAVHGTRRRGLAPLGRCQLPLPRASRAKRAGPEAAEVDSGQAMSGEPPVK